MCDFSNETLDPNKEWFVDSRFVIQFVEHVHARMEAQPDRSKLVEELQPAFTDLLSAEGWLPEEFATPDETSGMGGGIGQYVLYRAKDRSLTLFSLVIPAGSSTPVHDHLAWGLIGLYQGTQREQVYNVTDGDPDSGHAELELTRDVHVDTGEFFALLPPKDDIHRVTTTSDEPSISIHLLGNDTGCVIRHSYEPETSKVKAFRSGYSNLPCEEDEATAD
jgi:3-mercaptopropionate dioxygenase